MGLHRTLWSPDTCECQIEFEWDDEVPAEERIHTGKKVVKACDLHPQSEFNNCDDQFKHVLEQNNRRMKILGELIDSHPELMITKEDGTKILKPDIKFPFKYSGKGKKVTLECNLEGPSITKKHSDKVKSIVSSKFRGKVVVK